MPSGTATATDRERRALRGSGELRSHCGGTGFARLALRSEMQGQVRSESRVEHRYNPMDKPKREISQAEMWEKLSKHSRPNVSIENSSTPPPKEEAQSPQEKSEALDWEKPQKYYVLTKCGRYSVSKSFDAGVPLYTAWRRVPEFDSYIGIRKTPDEAKALCEAHLRAHPSDSRGPQLPRTAQDEPE